MFLSFDIYEEQSSQEGFGTKEERKMRVYLAGKRKIIIIQSLVTVCALGSTVWSPRAHIHTFQYTSWGLGPASHSQVGQNCMFKT